MNLHEECDELAREAAAWDQGWNAAADYDTAVRSGGQPIPSNPYRKDLKR